MVSETIIFPEMTDAGKKALEESEQRGDDATTTAVRVYMAMSEAYEFFLSKNKTRH